MARPTSFRLDEELLRRLEEEGQASAMSVSALVATLLDEGLKTRRFPGIVYREGPSGRRAGLIGGPDVWEVARDLRHAPGRGERRVAAVAVELGLSADRVRLAADFASAYPGEINRLIELDEHAAERVKDLLSRRDQLLSS